MQQNKVQVEKAIQSIRSLAQNANSIASDEFDAVIHGQRHPDDPRDRLPEIAEKIESAFLQLLTLSEALSLSGLNSTIHETYSTAKKRGLAKVDQFEDYHGWSYWAPVVGQFVDAIDAIYGSADRAANAINAYLTTILQNLQGAVTDKRCFGPPQNEEELHNRCEMVLRCFFPDLMRKPPLAKSVKGYIPDSGIPSLSTLIEYKFLSKVEHASSVADQILADTQGYYSSDWSNIAFVIYETERFKTIHEWQSLLRQCGVTNSVQVVLLHGENPAAD